MYSSEGIATKTFSTKQLLDTMQAQGVIREKGIIQESSNATASALSTFTSVLGFFVTKLPTAVGVSLSAVSLATGLFPSSKDILIQLSQDGEDFLRNQYYWMANNPQYDLIEIQYPYLKYYDVNAEGEDMTFVSGDGIVKKVHVKGGGWIIF